MNRLTLFRENTGVCRLIILRESLRAVLPLLLFTVSCSYVMWTPRTEIVSTDWVNRNTVVELLFDYEERYPWALAAGATDKRNFRTRVRTFRIDGDAVAEVNPVPSAQGSPVGHAYAFGGSVFFLIAQGDGIRWKTWLVRMTENGIEKTGGLQGENTLRFVPSPDRSRALLLVDQGREGSFLVFTRDDFSQDIRCGSSSSLSSRPGDNFVWSADGKNVFITRGGKVWSWNGCGPLKAALKFPACFNRATSYEGPVSEAGIEFYRETPENHPVLKHKPDWMDFSRGREISDAARIGRECP